MRIVTLALATVFAFVGSAQAQNTHIVKEGQSISAIAAKYGVTQSAILAANHLSNPNKLKLGQKLVIPGNTPAKPKKTTLARVVSMKPAQQGQYVVRNGDHDWGIARKMGTTVTELHRLNPKVDWRKLQIGQVLKAPPGKKVTLASYLQLPAKKNSAPAATGAYVVKKNDNDWLIARRVGTTPSKLRALNPSVKWTALQIGQKLRVPGSGSAAGPMLASAPRITSRYAVITGDNVMIRRGPSTNSGRVTTVGQGTAVTVLDRESGWYKLKFPKGTVGWVRGDLLKSIAPKYVAKTGSRQKRTNYYAAKSPAPKITYTSATSASDLMENAFGMLGVRYRYGASSRSATDCSGFTSQVYRTQGVKLPRTSREQSKVGAAVSKGALKEGDLVFFKGRSRISHVGIYIGNGKFIHASSGKGYVTTDTLASGHYANRFAGARRVKGSLPPSTKAILAKLKKEDEENSQKAKVAAKSSEVQPAFNEHDAPEPTKPKADGDAKPADEKKSESGK